MPDDLALRHRALGGTWLPARDESGSGDAVFGRASFPAMMAIPGSGGMCEIFFVVGADARAGCRCGTDG